MNRLLPTTIFLLAIIALSPSFSDSVFAQTIVPPTITDPRIDGDVSKAHINFENTFGASVSLNEILTGTPRANTGITISSLTFTPVPYSSQIQAHLDCNGDIYITTGTTSYSDTDLPISVIIDNPGTSNFATGDTLNLVVSINTSEYPKVATEPFCQLGTPETPTAVSSIIDGNGGFHELGGAFGITTVQINSSTYALVVSAGDSSVQIIDITDIAVPTVVSSVSDGSVDGNGDTFDQLDDPYDITTVTIGSSTYALVTSDADDGVQIIDITNLAAPIVASSITDGGVDGNGDIFDELDGARGITTTQIGSSTYALVTSAIDDGVQIIDITNPAAPTVTSSVSDGVGGFDELDGAHGITTTQIGSSTYALVTSAIDDGVQIIDITNPAAPTVTSSVSDGVGGFDELDGAHGITTTQIGSSTYALVASFQDDGVQIINITNPASPTVASSISDGVGGFDQLRGSFDIATIQIGSSTYALVTSARDDGVQIINITNPASPTVASSITDGGVDGNGNTFDELDGARGITTVQVGSSTYALVASDDDDGVQIIHMGNSQAEPATPEPATPEPATPEPATPEPATFENPIVVSSVTDGVNGFNRLNQITQITTVQIGQSIYSISAAIGDNGVQIIDITDPANPIAVSSMTEGDVDGNGNTFDELDGSFAITTVQIGSSTYALVASDDDDGVQIIDITNPAAPTAASSITDGGVDGNGDTFDELDGAFGITTVQIGQSTYALVTAVYDNGVQIIDITNPTAPTVVSSITDGGVDGNGDTFDELTGALGITTIQIDQSTYALIASFYDNGVQIIDITNPTAPTVVSSITDGGVDGNGNTFDELTGANDIITIQIGQSTYALIASSTDDGVQIINITNLTAPTVVSSITDGGVDGNGDTFDELGGARGITTIQIDQSIYALVASYLDDGIQIINITNPATPTAAFSINNGDDDGAGGIFGQLQGARDITTIQIDQSIYALVASRIYDGIQIIRIAESQPELVILKPATLENPLAVSSVTDGVNGFDTLKQVSHITTVTIDSSTYALVASIADDGIQIIDITNPATPTAVSSIINGTNGFNIIGGSRDITTVTIDSSIYALVASETVDGIQIIDITNPATPTAVSSIIDGDVDGNGNTFGELTGSIGITTVKIGQSTYALVASYYDNGVQIINITNPTAPTVASSITDGGVDANGNTFDELYGAIGITTVKIGQSTYALVAASLSNGIPIIDITNPAAPLAVSTVTDDVDGFDKFDEITQITTVKIGQSTYALATSALDDGGVQIIDITNSATPIIVSSITDGDVDANGNTFDELGGAYGITTIQIGSSTYALVASITDDGIQIIDITNPATPTTVSSITDGGVDANGNTFDELGGAYGITTVQIGSSTYALVASITDDGVQIIRIAESQSEPVTPEPVTPEPVTPEPVTPEPVTPEPVTPEPVTPEPVTPEPVTPEPVTPEPVTPEPVTPEPVTPEPSKVFLNLIAASSLTDGVGGFDGLDHAFSITTVQIGSSTYALVASVIDYYVQIIDITNPAAPTPVSLITNAITGVNIKTSPHDITTVKIGQSTYALVASDYDDGVQIIDISNPATPIAVSTIIDGDVDANNNTFDELNNSRDITTVKIGQSTYALVTAFIDDGVQIIDISNPAAPTAVSSVTDGVGGFDELDGANNITTVQIGNSIYALVSTSIDDGVQIIDISNPATPIAVSSVTDGVGGFKTLDTASELTTVKIGSSTYALVTSNGDDGVQIIDISNPATPTAVSSVTDGSIDGNGNTFDELDRSGGIDTLKIGSSTYALVTAHADDGVQIIDISNPASPTAVSSVSDGDVDSVGGIFDELGGAADITTVQIGSSTYALVASGRDDGVQIIQIVTLEPILTITHVGTGEETPVPFTDGMTIDNNTPRFFGTSEDVIFLTLDIDDDLVGNSMAVRPDGTWQRDWKHNPLADGTYTLNVKTQNNVNSSTYTFTVDTNNIADTVDVSAITPAVVITNVDVGGEVPIPFNDGMTIDTNTPRFFGTSNGVTFLTLDIDRNIVGTSVVILPDGAWQRDWANEPLDDGTYTLHVKTQNNVNSGTYTFTIDTINPINIPNTLNVSPTSVVSIANVDVDGVTTPFTDGMILDTNTPKFFGTSNDATFLTLDIDGDMVGNSSVVRSDGTWQRDWKHDPLADGTYTLNVKTQNNVNSGTYTIIIDVSPTPVVSIANVDVDGVTTPFTDGMTLDTNIPKFFGTSNDATFLTLDIDGDMVGNSSVVRSDGTWQRDWKHDPLADGTYTLNVKTQNNVNSGTYTIIIDVSPPSVVSIANVDVDGVTTPFTDGMILDTNTPKFFGTSNDATFLTLDIDGDMVGNSSVVRSDGTWQRDWKHDPLADGTYTLNVKTQNNVNSGTYTIIIDASPVAEPETPQVAEPETPQVAEPETPQVAEPETPQVAEPEIAERILSIDDSEPRIQYYPNGAQHRVYDSNGNIEYEYYENGQMKFRYGTNGDSNGIPLEAKWSNGEYRYTYWNYMSLLQWWTSECSVINGERYCGFALTDEERGTPIDAYDINGVRTFGYHPDGQVSKIYNSDGATIEFQYDQNGNQVFP